ncbi:uncharacterized protein LOC110190950 isoform X2 [Drosophila serrata]|uniref:uncharacterized protein LOC110190950 isoform X2 n=1 Tax=Drosophila serrata TaxID=7274 RepID=UPI000A1D0B84|nr:uncharacterized protein LOC110190950 isoform X2 [Drosophila serrata]
MEQTRVVVVLSNTESSQESVKPAGNTFSESVVAGRVQQQQQQPPASDTFQYGGEVSILDDRTLRLLYCQNASKPHLLLAQKFRFDVLTTQECGDEIPALLHCLFVERRDGFAMHLRVERECHLMFLLDTLVIQVNGKLQREGMQLERGIVRFRKLQEEDQRGNTGNSMQTQSAFSDTHGLMLWLMNQYRMRADLSTGVGHDALEVEYLVAHKETGIQFSVRLFVLLVAFEELSVSSLCGLRCYFSDDLITSSLVGTELISFMQYATNQSRSKPLYMIILFHVTTSGSQVNARNAQLLVLAHLASQQHSPQLDTVSASSSFAQLNQFENCQKEISDRFKQVHGSLMQYVQQAEQLKHYRQRFDEQLAQFEELLKQIANTEFGHMLQASQANLQKLNNLLEKNT